MSTALAVRPASRRGTFVPAAPHVRALPRIERVLYMCEAAQAKERRGESAIPFHASCLGRARSDRPVLERVPDPDGRFKAGEHVCTCPCHPLATMPRRHR